MRILITGHKGLIGQELYNRLKLFNDVVGDDKDTKEEITGNFDLMIHCAANVIIRETIKNPHLAIENIAITYQFMEYARKTGCKKVVIFSSGRVNHSEKNPYIVSKLFSENMAQAYHDCYDIEYMIIRPETVWGMNDHKERVIPAWILAALTNKPIIVYGTKNKELPPIYVTDFVDIVMTKINNWERNKLKIHGISGVFLSVQDIMKTILFATRSKSKVIYKPAEKTQPQCAMIGRVDSAEYVGDKLQFFRRIKEVVDHGDIANIADK